MLIGAHKSRLLDLAELRRRHDERDRELTALVRDEVIAAVDEGALHREIAEALGVSEVRVGQIAKAARSPSD